MLSRCGLAAQASNRTLTQGTRQTVAGPAVAVCRVWPEPNLVEPRGALLWARGAGYRRGRYSGDPWPEAGGAWEFCRTVSDCCKRAILS